MYLVEISRQIFNDIRVHKVRSLLAAFGIVWGTVSVVVLLSLGHGFYDYNKKAMEKLAPGALLIFPGTTSLPYQGMPQGQPVSFKVNDVLQLPLNNKDIDKMTFEIRIKKTVAHAQKQFTERIRGIGLDYAELQKLDLTKGSRFINSLDIEQKTRVAVIGDELKKSLFGEQDAIGQTILIAGVPFYVVGVLQSQESNFSFGDPRNSTSVFIPFTVFQALWGIDISVEKITVLPKDLNKTDEVRKEIMAYFAAKYFFDPTDERAVFIPDINQVMHYFSLFFRAVEIFLGFCGVMTLGVGGVGVANIMFLIVSERTREIGLKMALGAKPYHIMLQIVLEALMLVMMGGSIGFLLSWTIVALLQTMSLPVWLGVPVISYGSMITTILILTVVGVCVGIFPAKRAAAMQPVAALAF